MTREVTVARPRALGLDRLGLPAGARWLPPATAGTARALVAAVAGLVAAQMALVVAPEAGLARPLALGGKVGLGCWVVLALAQVFVDTVRGGHVDVRPDHQHSAEPEGPAGAEPSGGAQGLLRFLRHAGAGQILAIGALLLTAALLRTPSRLVVNLLGFGLVALPVWWVVERRAGRRSARLAAVAIALLAFLPTPLDVRQQPPLAQAEPLSPYRWTVGWPASGWRLRHDVRLDQPAPSRPGSLRVWLDAPYAGPASMFASVNGVDVGPLSRADHIDRRLLTAEIPPRVVAGQLLFRIELTQAPVDPTMRVVAQRWTGGATLRDAASSYFDGERWWSGTFNDLAGERRGGLYVVELSLAD